MSLTLSDICEYRTETTTLSDIDSYLSTESMLPNKQGITRPSSLPDQNRFRIYRCGDTLVSNIRPYFKKIWQADHDGTCSADVLVFKPLHCDPNYLHWVLSDDGFFDYMTATSRGTKMPRGDKDAIMRYRIDPCSFQVQKQIAAVLNPIRSKILINARINDHLAGLCESITVNTSADEKTILADISSQVTTKIAYDEAAIDSYVSTESLLPNKGGRQLASSLPTTGKVTSFKPGDTLVSNIRPYFKKVWYADRNGTCSNDVVVFRAKEPSLAPYLYSILRSDSFFEHVMAGAKGTKMPRGDKKQMMQYRVSKCCDENNLRLLSSMLGQISSNNRESGRIAELRDALLPKLMSGEIDISRIDIKQLNGHLFDS